jgi:hypothetical protein
MPYYSSLILQPPHKVQEYATLYAPNRQHKHPYMRRCHGREAIHCQQ